LRGAAGFQWDELHVRYRTGWREKPMQAVPDLIAKEMLVKLGDNAVAPVRSATQKMLGPGTKLTRLTPNLPWYVLESKKISGLPPTEAFELAHRLLSVPQILAIEPGFESKSPVSIEPESMLDFALKKDDQDPNTTGKHAWHLEQVLAKEARLRFGVTGKLVRVAHPDTGYTLHPELITGASIRADLGYNFEENTASPIEPLSTIDHGHGTATASVLVGIEGKQHTLPNEEDFVEGVAPGAELVPFRVDTNVWWIFSAKNDAKAIDRAVAQGCHVISMSRSGTDQEALRDAIVRATAHGIIVVAAAGNCNLGCKIRSPANYDEVVCAAGTTYEKRFWSSSSHGIEVTIAAPAYSVYRARAFKEKKKYAYSVERSSGTSYATPIVAGAAALWLERHGGTAAIGQKLGGLARVPVAFKHLLKTAGFQAGVAWDPKQNGPGILDCVALLSAPLPSPGDFSFIEQSMRPSTKATPSGHFEMLSLLKPAIPPRTDGRAAKLLALELETSELLSPNAETEGLAKMSAKLTKGARVSSQLREVLAHLK
jgi:subtilisin family serine protease